MAAVRIGIGFIAAVVAGFLLSTASLTFHTLTSYPGFEMSADVYFSTFMLNLAGLAAGSPFAGILAVALAIAFVIAAVLKRVLPALAPVAYVIAGAVATPFLFYLVETVMIGGGVGAFFGARGVAGMGLQALAGGFAGLVFTVIAVRRAG